MAAAVACKAGISAMLALCPLYTEELFPVNLQVAVLQACKLVSPIVTLLLMCQSSLCNLQDLLLESAILEHSSAIQNCLEVLVRTGSVTSCVLHSCTYCQFGKVCFTKTDHWIVFIGRSIRSCGCTMVCISGPDYWRRVCAIHSLWKLEHHSWPCRACSARNDGT